MTQPKKVVSPDGQYFAEVLHLLRCRAKWSQNDLGGHMSYTGAAVSAVETCVKPATDEFVQAAEKALDAGGVIGAASKYLRLERYPEHFQGFVRLEQDALSVSSFCTEEDAERLVTARMERAALLTRKPVCVIHIVLEETALRRRIGGPGPMKAQYEHLIACARRPNVVPQVMPLERGEHAGVEGPLTLIETAECERLAYMECNGTSTLVSKPEEVGLFARRCAMLGQQALRPEESLDLIKQLAGEL